jgi:hypothetical protein
MVPGRKNMVWQAMFKSEEAKEALKKSVDIFL